MNKKLLISQKRKERDIGKLISTGYKVKRSETNFNELTLKFNGPKDTLYENGEWTILIYLPQEYPYKSPSIGFVQKIYHPNIDFGSGTICLDVINQAWSPMYELVNIFEIFLPQLLLYPNPSDPLNLEAAEFFKNDLEAYERIVRKMVSLHAVKEDQKDKEKKKELERVSSEDGCEGSCTLSDMSQLSELSDTSGIFLEDDIF